MKKKKKIYAKKSVFSGLKFSIMIAEDEFRHCRDDFYPVINTRRLEDAVFYYLIDHPISMTGAQALFIRKYMDMT